MEEKQIMNYLYKPTPLSAQSTSNSNSSIFLFQTIKNDVKVLHVTIYNSEGREVFSAENLIENNNHQYAIRTELSPGIYLFKLLDANNKVHLLKHVVID